MNQPINIQTNTPEETIALGKTVGAAIEKPVVIALFGDLGSGKTVWVKGLAAGLGVGPEYPVTSPTFALVNEYEGRLNLFHADLYRLSGAADTEDLGFDEMLSGKGVVAVEWAERMDDPDFAPDIAVEIRETGETGRRFTFFFYGPGLDNLVETVNHF